jgi:galactokinase
MFYKFFSQIYTNTQNKTYFQLLAKKGTAKLIEFNPLTATDVKLPQGATFVIANSLVNIPVNIYSVK